MPSASSVSFLDQNADKIQGAERSTASSRPSKYRRWRYPVSRPLFFYVKKAHVGAVPGIAEYLASSPRKGHGAGRLPAEKGLIPMPDAEREQFTPRRRDAYPMGSL